MKDINLIQAEILREFCRSVFHKIGLNEKDASLASDVLLSADLRGIDSHGVARLSGYVRLWEAKRVNPKPDIKIVHETPSTAVVDGDAGLGLVVAPFAMNLAIEKAKNVGSGWVSVKNSNHFGIAAFHSRLALNEKMIGISMTNASPLVAPTFSTERMLGTNPMCYAIPAGKYDPVIVDMATSAAANGKLEIAERLNKNIPDGWVQDAAGNSSTDPKELKKGGSLLPLGSDRDHGSHKGFGLSAVVDIFSAILSGANYGPWVPPFVSFLPLAPDMPGEGIGHFFGAMRVDAFRPYDEFISHMDNWIERFKNAKTTGAQKVIIPGEPETEAEKDRLKNGIPVNPEVIKDLNNLAEKLQIQFHAS